METYISSGDFNQNPSKIKQAVIESQTPVIVTEYGTPCLAVLPITKYENLKGKNMTLKESLAMDTEHADITFEPERAEIIARIPDFDV